MATTINTLEMFPFQTENITYEIIPDKYGAEYWSNIYEKPKTCIKKCFDNKFIQMDSDSNKISGFLVLNQAWEQFDRKLRGFEFNPKSPYRDYDNMECHFIDFTVSPPNNEESISTVVIHTYHRLKNKYIESINSKYGLFFNRQNELNLRNEDLRDGENIIIYYIQECIENILLYFLKSSIE